MWVRTLESARCISITQMRIEGKGVSSNGLIARSLILPWCYSHKISRVENPVGIYFRK